MGEGFQGRIINKKYRLVSELGRGAMGMVYRAEQLGPRGRPLREVALKIMLPQFSSDPSISRRFLHEMEITTRLHHPHIVDVYDADEDETGLLYYAMELVPGRTLRALLTEQAPLTIERTIKIAQQICLALTAVHGRTPTIVHRDLKPPNIFVEERNGEDWIKIGDFGISKILKEEGTSLTVLTRQPGSSPGTPRYMAPEQWLGEEIDERIDLYALGVILYEMLTGQPPFRGTSEALAHQHTTQPPPPLPAFIPQSIRELVEKLLAKSSQNRPASALYVSQVLEEALTEEHSVCERDKELLEKKKESSPTPQESREKPQNSKPVIKTDSRSGGREWTSLFLFSLPWREGLIIFLPIVFILIAVSNIEQILKYISYFTESFTDKKRSEEQEKQLRILHADPLELVSLKLLNTSRNGTPLPNQKTIYLDNEVQYLTWEVELKNRLAGMEGATYRFEGRFFDPEGGTAGKSDVWRFIRLEEEKVKLQGVTLLEGLKERAKGDYQFELYWNEKKLATQTIRIQAEPKKAITKGDKPKTRGPTVSTPPVAPAPSSLPDPAIEERNRSLAEEAKRAAEEAKRQALIQERSKKPLDLIAVRFSNTSKEGKQLSGQDDRFPASEIRFIGWEAQFRNRLQDLVAAYHRIEATYYTPDGQKLGTVQDAKQVDPETKDVTFTARIGNSTGGAFRPGTYRVDFFVNGYPLSSKKFTVEDDRERVANRALLPLITRGTTNELVQGDLARVLQHHTGSILGLAGDREVALELDFHPQAGGSLHGAVIIHESGFDTTPLTGKIEGNHVDFRSSTGRGTFHFQGTRDEDRLTGTFTILPSGKEGIWSVKLK